MTDKTKLTTLTGVGFQINAAIEKGQTDTVSFEEIYASIENNTLLNDLDTKIPDTFDFSLIEPGSERDKHFNNAISNVAAALQGRERRKVNIEKSGLHLLIAIIFEAIQQLIKD